MGNQKLEQGKGKKSTDIVQQSRFKMSINLVEVQFFMRTNETNSNYGHIYFHISVDSLRTKSPLSARIKLEKTEWHNALSCMVDRHCQEQLLLNNIEAEIKMQATILRTKGQKFTAESLKKVFHKEEKYFSFIDLFNKYVPYRIEKHNLAKGSQKTLHIIKSNVIRFLEQNNYKDLACEEFKPKIIDEMELWFRHNLKACGIAHLKRHIQLINAVLNYAVLYEYADKNPLQYYKFSRKTVQNKVIYLTILEQELLEKAVFTDNKLVQVRDIFVFASCLGLACIDRICFDFETHTYLKDDGTRWFSMQRNKSKVYAEMPIPTKALEILKKYNYKLPSVADNQNISVENQLNNRYLKIIAEILGIKKHLTTHTSRKTACSNWLRAGVNENVIAAMMGWTSTKMLKLYSEVENEMITKELHLKLKQNYL